MSHLGLTYSAAARLTFFIPIALLAPLSSYFLIRRFLRNDLAAFVGALSYTFNTYFLVIQTAHLPIAFAYALAPFIFLEFDKVISTPSFRRPIVFALVYSLGFIYEARIMYIVLWMLFLYFTYSVAFRKSSLSARTVSPRLAVSSLLLFFLNMFWLLGSIPAVEAIKETVERGLFGNAFFNTQVAFTLFHPFWTGMVPAEFVVQPIPPYFWLIPLLAFSALLLKRPETPKEIYFFGALALLGVLLTKQSAPPFPGLYLWLYEHFPGFNLFREASKFFLIIALSYSVLIGYTVQVISDWFRKREKVLASYVLIVAASFLFLWNVKPLLTQEIGTLFVSREIPSDYLVLKNFIHSQEDYFRTLWIPATHRFGFYSSSHPAINMVNLTRGGWQEFVPFEGARDNWPDKAKIIDLLGQPYSHFVLNTASIKYVIVPSDPGNEIYKHYGPKRDFISFLDQIPFLQREQIGAKEVVVYRNPGFIPPIYVAEQIIRVKDQQELSAIFEHMSEGTRSAIFLEDPRHTQSKLDDLSENKPRKTVTPRIEFKKINATKYRVIIRGASEPFLLVFSKSFHEGWKAYIVGQNPPEVEGDKYVSPSIKGSIQNENLLAGPIWETWLRQPLPEENHLLVNAYANSWWIKKRGDFEIILEFWPQRLFYLGLAISVATLVFCSAYLVWDWRQRSVRQR
ncbi:glycosyltransferase family protein [Candidatus Hakubella thermalkaliphila]|nr:hypothetical protein [Candidatus Hakubella thermalkaliphila]